MRIVSIAVLALASACDLATEGTGGAVATGADAGSGDLTPPDAQCPAYDGAGTVCLGSFEVRNFADIELVAGCARITGDLDLGANGLIEIALPLLERVDGTVRLQAASSLERIALPELKEIGGSLVGSADPVLAELSVPRLRTVGGELQASLVDTAMTAWSVDCLDTAGSLIVPGFPVLAPRLTAVAGDVDAALQAPLLETVGGGLGYQQGMDVPALYRVGDLHLSSTDTVNLPSLRTVQRSALLGCDPEVAIGETALELPVLRRAETLRTCPWPALTSIDLPSLTVVAGPAGTGGLTVSASSPPVLVNAPALARTTGLTLDGPLFAPVLATVSGDLVATSSIDLPSLATVTGRLRLFVRGGTMVFPALTSVGLELRAVLTTAVELRAPVLGSIGGPLWIGENAALADIEFPTLTSLGGYLKINKNPQLPTCQAEALRDQLIAAGWTGTWTIGNNGAGTCP